jgi:hypothetical protein
MPPARLRFALVLLLLGAAASARAKAGPELSDSKAVDAWVETRVRNAKAGTREIVRLPIVRRSTGWGCRCPWHFLGNSVDSYGGKSWLALTTEPGVALPEKRDGWVQIAEGYFTGATTTEDYSKECNGCKDWIYTLHELHVERARPAPKDAESLRVHLLLAGKGASEKVALLADGKPWLVMVSSVARGDKTAAAQAVAQRDKLIKAGFAGAAVIDSRSAPLLSCCYHVVVAGRFATQAEATALAKVVKKKRFPASVKRGF